MLEQGAFTETPGKKKKKEFIVFGIRVWKHRKNVRILLVYVEGKLERQNLGRNLIWPSLLEIITNVFFQIYQQQKEGQNLLPLLDAAGNINTEDEEEADVVNVFFTSVFNSQTSYSQDTEPPDLEDSDREQNKPPKFKRKLEGA